MTPQEFSIVQREFLIRTEKQNAKVLLFEFEQLKSQIDDYLTTNLNGKITVQKIEQNGFLEKFLDFVEKQLQLIRNPFTQIITRGQQRVINFTAESLGKFLGNKPEVFAPDREAIQKLIGRSQLGTSIGKLFDKLPPVQIAATRNSFIEGFALGESNVQIAKRLTDAADVARWRAMAIARTETNEAYRAATRDFYAEAEITEYVWMSALSSRTCVICWSLHGRKFKSSKKVFSHPNCRCVLIPKLKNSPEIETGAAKFAKLEKGYQKQILGEKRFEMFEKNKNLNSFVDSRNQNNQIDFFVKPLS